VEDEAQALQTSLPDSVLRIVAREADEGGRPAESLEVIFSTTIRWHGDPRSLVSLL
jgi:hypothetical protein